MAYLRPGPRDVSAVARRLPIALSLVAAAFQFAGRPSSCRASSSADLSRAARRLGSSEFSARHEAGDLLLKAGPSAIPFLREASESDSPEIRFRASEILQRIELRILDAQKAEILSGSLPEGEMPAWDRYLQIVDDSAASRRLFVAMLERSPQLMLSFGAPDFAEVFDRRVTDWGASASPWARKNSTDGVEELISLLLAAAQPECAPTAAQAQLISRSAEFSWLRNHVLSGERSQALKAILIAWIQKPGQGTADARLHLAQQYNYPEGAVPAREIISNQATGLEIQSAILFLSNVRQEQDIPRLEKLLDNETELQTFQSQRPNEGMKTQVRDVALAALWRMRKQDPARHGMKSYVEQNGAPRPGSIGFQHDDDRIFAINHWRGWRKRFVKADLPVDGWAIEGRSG